MLKYMDFVFPTHFEISVLSSTIKENETERVAFMVRFRCPLYRFRSTETLHAVMNDEDANESLPLLVETIRRRSWHKTIVA